MSIIAFENYQHIAQMTDASNTEVAGRFMFQQEAERRILSDLLIKLDLKVTDILLEIGCGPGNLLVPLANFCAQATGIDNEAAIARLNNRLAKCVKITGIAGNFFQMNLPATSFDKIIIYSVLQYMSNQEEAFYFIDRALSLLQPGGRLLVGDLPNCNKKVRFGSSKTGQQTAMKYAEQLKSSGSHPMEVTETDSSLVAVDDSFLLDLMMHIRNKGFEAYVLPQPLDLPFGGSREDILVMAHS